MQLQAVTLYKIDGQCFDTVKKAKEHIEGKIFKHIQKGTEYAGAGSEPSKMRLELMRYILEHKEELASLLTANFGVYED